MNNIDIITTIVSIALTIISVILGYLSKKNTKAKKYYESFLKVEEKIKELCITAEKNYEKSEQKKKYVLAATHQYLLDNKFEISEEKINKIIESIIDISNNINKKGTV